MYRTSSGSRDGRIRMKYAPTIIRAAPAVDNEIAEGGHNVRLGGMTDSIVGGAPKIAV
jgi:hypothetical protein